MASIITSVEDFIWFFFKIPSHLRSGIMIKDIVDFILVPSALLLIFLTLAAEAFLPESMRKKWKALIALVFYLVIITQGFYVQFAIFAKNYIILFIILAFGLFVITRFVPMKYWKAATQVAAKYGEKKMDIKRLEDELKMKERERDRIQRFLEDARAAGRTRDIQIWELMLAELEREIDRLKLRIEEIKKFP
jgi:glucan phosphoethanolaminetransferase (alkaline phosphatase superfamily)